VPIESDNEEERQARIAELVRKLREAQERVEALAAETRRRAEEMKRTRLETDKSSPRDSE
jgi:hypothetical protein